MKEWAIGEVARQSGLTVSTIRYYESLGLLPSPPRLHGHRRYDPSILQRLIFIQAAQNIGFSLGQIRLVIDVFASSNSPTLLCQGIVQKKLTEVENLIMQMVKVKHILEQSAHCTCTTLMDCTRTLSGDEATTASGSR